MSFDRLARGYRALEWLLAGGRLQRCRTALLPALTGAREILIAGEGPGRWLEAADPALPGARFTVVDESAAMLRLAGERWRAAGGDPARLMRVQARLPKAAARLPRGAFDVIVTPFFLDCFEGEELGRVVGVLAGCATPAARWLVCDFRVPARGPARWRARAVLWLAYRFFHLATGLGARRLVDPAPFLRQHGFTLEREELSEWGLLSASLWRRDGRSTVAPLPWE